MGVSRRQMRHQSGPAQFHFVPILQHAVNRVRFPAGFHLFQRRHILFHCHHARRGKFLDHRVAFHMIAVCVATENNLDVREAEAQFFRGRADNGNRRLEVGIDKNVALGCRDQE